jgi:protein-S-isoprenylcysteine O-methyltransferase Ste14
MANNANVPSSFNHTFLRQFRSSPLALALRIAGNRLDAGGVLGGFRTEDLMKTLSAIAGIPTILFYAWIAYGCPALRAIDMPIVAQIAFDVWLLGTFYFLHSALAGIDRKEYCTIAGITAAGVMACWQPIGGELYRWEWGAVYCPPLARLAIFGAIHYVILNQIGIRWFFGYSPDAPKGLITSGPYKWCRHPMHLNILVLVFCSPVMTYETLLFGIVLIGYLIIAIPIEEDRLIEAFGIEYAWYMSRVPMIFPGTKWVSSS